MTDNTCNGWANYETWLAHLWLQEDPAQLEYWQAKATDYTTAYALGQDMRCSMEDAVPDLGCGLYADLLSAALHAVRWRDIAESIINDASWQAAYPTPAEVEPT
jgi:hypothetical protein